jgi:hypothetical protein
MMGISLFGTHERKNIAVIPFINNGNIEYEKLSDYIPSYIILLLKDLPGYRVTQLLSVKQVMMKNRLNLYDLKNQQTLLSLAGELESDVIIGGFINEEASRVFVSCTIYKVNGTAMNMENRVISMELDSTDLFTINNAFDRLMPVFEDMTKIDLDPGFLTVTTDYKCSLVVDGYCCGNTPIRVPLYAGEHSIMITHTSAGKEEIVHTETLLVAKGEHIPREITVFRKLSINAEEKCTVFIDGEERGPTPFEDTLYSGREYQVKVLYYNNDGTTFEVFHDIISTRDEITPFYFTAKGSISINCPSPFKADIDSIGKTSLPIEVEGLIPGPHRVKVVLPDDNSVREWVFIDKTINLPRFSSVSLDLGRFGYKRQIGFAFIPSAAQFHNREPVKGWLVLTSILAAGVATGLSAWQWFYWDGEYNSLWDNRYSPTAGWSEDITHAENYRNMYNIIFIGGCVLFGGIYTYSMIDGIVTMNEISDLIYTGSDK